tara:strand:+ start:600 stop:740 length:141 start_codon:yes stop_codon:yes gene_type:complete
MVRINIYRGPKGPGEVKQDRVSKIFHDKKKTELWAARAGGLSTSWT